MKLQDVKKLVRARKYMLTRSFPEIGSADGDEYVMDAASKPGVLAVVVWADERSGPPYRIRRFRVSEVAGSAELILVGE